MQGNSWLSGRSMPHAFPPPQTGGATAGLSSIAPSKPPHLGQKAQLDVTEDR